MRMSHPASSPSANQGPGPRAAAVHSRANAATKGMSVQLLALDIVGHLVAREELL
eukprot:COSAG01_NODE_2347_length_7858_cov_6.577007_6_plen_55_part_00